MRNSTFVHRLIPSAEKDSPVLLLLHGTGGNEEDLIPLGQRLLPGAALLGVSGRVLENGMPPFFKRFAEGVFDLEDLRLQTKALAEFLDWARQEYQSKGREVVAVGYSNEASNRSEPALALSAAISGRDSVPRHGTVSPRRLTRVYPVSRSSWQEVKETASCQSATLLNLPTFCKTAERRLH